MYKRILLAFDGSDASKRALEHAVEVAKKFGSRLFLVSVVPRVMMPIFPDEGFGAAPISAAKEFGEYQEKMSGYYKDALMKAEREIKKNTPELVVDTILELGRPSYTIIEVAEDKEIDLIIIGSRGLGGITGWILGSTSRRVVESCTKPILIVK
jgi:nucleotide-binding universal stress UspA family protein